LIDSKKLNHVLASSEAVAIAHSMSEATQGDSNEHQSSATKPLELVYDHGEKIIRFPDVDTLIDFLRRAA
jgi:hypothetical protein